jgi:hypothetical protein
VCVNLCEKEIAARGYQSWRQSTGFLASSFLSGKYKKKNYVLFYLFFCVCLSAHQSATFTTTRIFLTRQS